MKSNAYAPMTWNYIYRSAFLTKIQARFEEGIIHEDELLTPIVLSQAEKIIAVDVDFYYYRQRDGTLSKSSNIRYRIDSLFRVTARLLEFAGRYEFSGENGDLKSWLYVKIFRIYCDAVSLLSGIKDTSYSLPEYHLDRFWRDCPYMTPCPQKICKNYYMGAEAILRKYIQWRTSEWVASIEPQLTEGKKLMLIFNLIRGEELSLKLEDVPAGWVITADRRYFQQAKVVLFYLPSLLQEMEHDLQKSEEQIWASRYLVSEQNHPSFNDLENKAIFDLWICYPTDSTREEQKEHPLVSLCRQIDSNYSFKFQTDDKLTIQ